MFQLFLFVFFNLVFGDPLLAGPCKMKKEQYDKKYKEYLKTGCLPPYKAEYAQDPSFFEVMANDYEAVDPIKYIQESGMLPQIRRNPAHLGSIAKSVTTILDVYTMTQESAAPAMPSDPQKFLDKLKEADWPPAKPLGTSLKLTQQVGCIEICGNLLFGDRDKTKELTKLENPQAYGLWSTAWMAISDWASWHDIDINDDADKGPDDKNPRQVVHYLLDYGKIAATRCEDPGFGGSSEIYFLIPDLNCADTKVEWTEHEFWTMLLMRVYASEVLGLSHVHFIVKKQKSHEENVAAKGLWAKPEIVNKAWEVGVNCCKCEDGAVGFSFLRKCNDVCLHETLFKVLDPPAKGACNSMQSCYEKCGVLQSQDPGSNNQASQPDTTVPPVALDSSQTNPDEVSGSNDQASQPTTLPPVAPDSSQTDPDEVSESDDQAFRQELATIIPPVVLHSIKKPDEDSTEADSTQLGDPQDSSQTNPDEVSGSDDEAFKREISTIIPPVVLHSQTKPDEDSTKADSTQSQENSDFKPLHSSQFDSSEEPWSKYFLVAATSSILTLFITNLYQTKRTGASTPLLNV